MNARVGIVVLNWNGGAQTIACVESARAQGYRDKFIIVVDSRSEDEERNELRRRYGDDSGVELCFLDANRGYTGGMNAGIARALARGADMTLLVTQDAMLTPGTLAAMVAAAAADPAIGIVGPTVVDARTNRILSIGERMQVALLCVPRTVLRYRRRRQRPYEVGGIIGCVMLLTRQCMETVGPFDESLFMYYEEVDLCLRARRAAFKVVCTPHAVVTHDGVRGYLSGFTAASAELKARNLLRVMRRCAAPADWAVLLPTYSLLLAGSVSLYVLRARFDVITGLVRGAVAGIRGRGGAPHAAANRVGPTVRDPASLV